MPDPAVTVVPPDPPSPISSATRGRGEHTVEGADWSRWPLVAEHLLPALGVYLPSDNVVEDNRRRLAAGLPMVRRGRWGR